MSSDFFQGMGITISRDVIFALKSRRADVGLKMEITVRTDASGVNFFSMYQCHVYAGVGRWGTKSSGCL